MYYLNDVEEGGETAFPVADDDAYEHDVSGSICDTVDIVFVNYLKVEEKLAFKIRILQLSNGTVSWNLEICKNLKFQFTSESSISLN